MFQGVGFRVWGPNMGQECRVEGRVIPACVLRDRPTLEETAGRNVACCTCTMTRARNRKRQRFYRIPLVTHFVGQSSVLSPLALALPSVPPLGTL